MKYYPPKQGPYESGLTAKLMCNIVDGVIKKHITQEDIGITNKKFNKASPEKLWEKPEIRSELEEFVMSYLIDDLNGPLHGFKEIFTREGSSAKIEKERLESYVVRLEQQYSSRDKAYKSILELFGKIKQRGKRLYEETNKISYLKKVNKLVQINTRDAFAHIASIYTFLELDINKIKNTPQS